MTLNTPLRVEKNREDCVRIVDKDGYPLTAFEPDYSHGDDYRALVQAANRQAAAEKLAEAVEGYYDLNTDCEKTLKEALAAYRETVEVRP